MVDLVLVLNCGSSSVKLALINPETGERPVFGLAERVGTAEAALALDLDGTRLFTPLTDPSHRGVLADALALCRGWLHDNSARVVAVGHRVVHGGAQFTQSVAIDDEVVAGIRRVSPLAPLHNPANLVGIEAATAELPGVPQVAVFDTAFHAQMPPRAYRYAVPGEWYAEQQVRRYGFHGTSHRYVSEEAARLLGRPVTELRLITAHLGNGCSVAAVRDGVSVDTSMGLTPLEGLVMGTRSGDIDPGILEYVAGRTQTDVSGVLNQLNKASGLLGLSGLSNDMRTITEAAAAGNAAAQLAVDVFCYRLAKYVAAYVVPLGRLDALVFTGGIGENAAGIRAQVIEQLGFLGLDLDPTANAAGGARLITHLPGEGTTLGPVALVVPTDEELVIARDAIAVTHATPNQAGPS